ncbi:MAG TPA: tetratricopeptide repeat protein, partial [Abditibacteriaceae bacterium]|jgi:tetratricopeptide (TPR) repeat protein
MHRLEKAGGLVMAARAALRKGQRDDARAKLQQAFAIAPTDVGALELLGDLFFEEGEQEKAIAVFERGLKFHPRHVAFEEKIAIAKLDLAEMEADKLRRQHVLEHGDTESWQDKNPGVAGFLSLALPGAGQFYNDEYERGATFLGVAVVTFVAWFWPITAAVKRVTASFPAGGNRPGFGETVSTAFSNMGGVTQFLLWSMILTWIGTYLYSAYDASQLAIRAAEERKRALGI